MSVRRSTIDAMPMYPYRCERGHRFNVPRAAGELPRREVCPECGIKASRDWATGWFNVGSGPDSRRTAATRSAPGRKRGESIAIQVLGGSEIEVRDSIFEGLDVAIDLVDGTARTSGNTIR